MSWELLEDETGRYLLDKVDWEHSFVREVSVVSPSYVLSEGNYVIAPDCLPSARVFVSSPSIDIHGLELLFIEVEEFSVWFAGSLCPNFTFKESSIRWKFSSGSKTIVCRSVYFRLLDENTWGRGLRYGWEDIYDEGGTFIFPE